MDKTIIDSLKGQYRTVDSIFSKAGILAGQLGAKFFDMGCDFYDRHFFAIVICNIGPGEYDDIAIFKVLRDIESNMFSVSLVANHVVVSNPGSGRVEDVYYEVCEKVYLTRIEADACSGSLLAEMIFTQGGMMLPSNRGHASFVYNEIFGTDED